MKEAEDFDWDAFGFSDEERGESEGRSSHYDDLVGLGRGDTFTIGNRKPVYRVVGALTDRGEAKGSQTKLVVIDGSAERKTYEIRTTGEDYEVGAFGKDEDNKHTELIGKTGFVMNIAKSGETEDYVPKGDHMQIPAKYLASHMGEYRTEPFWINFRKKSDEEKEVWAETVDLSEPVEVTVFKDGQFMHGDGHHRVRAATLREKNIPIIITRNDVRDKNKDPNIWKEWIRLVQAGNHPADLNPDKYNINSIEQVADFRQRAIKN